MYLYEGHTTGRIYASEEYLDYDCLYCEQCGDSDDFIGAFETKKGLKNLLLKHFDYETKFEYDEYWTIEDGVEHKKETMARIKEIVDRIFC